MTFLFEILIPVSSNDGIEFGSYHHAKWDFMVVSLTGGLTRFGSVDGQWRSPSGEIFVEKMIPVRIACTQEQIDEIADFSAKHYKQQAMMYYLISSAVTIKNYE